MAGLWRTGSSGREIFASLRADRRVCGIALYAIPFGAAPGFSFLRSGVSLSQISDDDPALPPAGKRAALVLDDRAFNRIVAPSSLRSTVPPAFVLRNCAGHDGELLCVFARYGGCDTRRDFYQINRQRARVEGIQLGN